MDFLFSALPGLAIAAACFVVYKVCIAGVPAAVSWVKTKWSSGKARIDQIDSDLTHAYDRIEALEKQVQSLFAKGLPAGVSVGGAAPIAPAAPVADPLPVFLQKPDAAPQPQA